MGIDMFRLLGSTPLGTAEDLNLLVIDTSSVAGILNTLFVIIGAAAVIMLIVGGFMFVTSAGNPEMIKRAKNTILYAIIGVVVATLAVIIVNLVLLTTI